MLHSLKQSLDASIASGNYNLLLDIVKAYRNGFVYGVKIRAPHALLMTLLFKRGPITDMSQRVFRATKQHAMTLGKFAALFKICLALLKILDPAGASPETRRGIHTFLSGFLVGSFVWGQNNAINMQINLYLLSRVTMALGKLALLKLASGNVISSGVAPKHTFLCFGATVWGLVMWLFYEHPKLLQESLASSMQYIYLDSTKYTDLRTLIWHNK